MLLGGASSTFVSRPTQVPSQKMARRFGGREVVFEGMIAVVGVAGLELGWDECRISDGSAGKMGAVLRVP